MLKGMWSVLPAVSYYLQDFVASLTFKKFKVSTRKIKLDRMVKE